MWRRSCFKRKPFLTKTHAVRRSIVGERLEDRCLLAADVIISEVVTNNDGSLLDGDGATTDWIELYNLGDETQDLSGWHLTDDAQLPDKWTFPAVQLGAGEFLTVFASGKSENNYVDAGGKLHTNFRLSSQGEYLALVRPDLTRSWEASIPELPTDVSFGVPMESTSEPLIAADAVSRTRIPTNEQNGDWTGGAEPFDDASWIAGNGESVGVGYSIQDDTTPGLVAEWLFETTDGSPVSDGQTAVGQIDETAGKEGGPFAGTAIGGPTENITGLAYSSDVPDGIGSTRSLTIPAPEDPNNHVRIPLDENNALTQLPIGDFRIEAWFKTTDAGRNILAGSYSGPATSINLELHTSNRGRIYVQGPNSITDVNVTLPNDSRDGNWHHLAGVRRGQTVQLYYDGELVGNAADTAGDFVINKSSFYIGRDHRTTSVVFNGSLDNVRFYNSADQTNLVASYDFETSSSQPVDDGQLASGQIDESVQGLHGIGSSADNDPEGTGINYAADAPPSLSDSDFGLEIDEGNRRIESFSVPMTESIADLTLGDFTLQTWFKSRDLGRSILMGSYTGPDSALNFELHTNNRLRVYIQNANGGTTDLNVSVDSVGNSRDGEWHFASAVRRGDSVELYLDGELVSATTDVAGSYRQTARNFFFGRDSRTGDTRFDGSLDNVRMWNVALTAEQIRMMAEGATPEQVTVGAFEELLGSNIQNELKGVNSSALVRVPFHVDDPGLIDRLILQMKYDDGFVAYINGQEVARRNAPDEVSWNSNAIFDRQTFESETFEDIGIRDFRSLLHNGENILAIHGLNVDANAKEFLVLPELIAVSTTIDREQTKMFLEATPSRPNGEGVLGILGTTEVSIGRGFYDRSDLNEGGRLHPGIALTNSTPDATIRYTIDGSWPTANHGIEYTEPIVISTTTTLRAAAFLAGYAPGPVVTNTYLFLQDVIRQPSNPGANDPGDPFYPLEFPQIHQTRVRADYEMDPDVVEHPLYADSIINDLKSIPTMSIVMDMDDIFNQPNGIWSNSQRRGPEWERLTSVEYFDPNDLDREFMVNSAIRIQGRASRVPSSSIKHSFRLLFKEEYGPADNAKPTGGPPKLEFPLFPESDVDRFDTVVLRGGYNYSYVHNDNSQNRRAQYIRERFMRESQLATGQLAAHGSYVHLYVNGLYFGLFAPQERPDASFMAEHLGGNKEDYDVISAGQVQDGSADAWNELLARAAEDLSVAENYQAVLDLLDVESLIDYMIVHLWGGTTDWPAPGGQLRNWVVGRHRTNGEGFKFFVWDAEYSIQQMNDNRVNVRDANTPAFLYHQLRDNAEFRLLFADHVAKHFFGDGALTADQNQIRYAQLADEIEDAIVGESARWGDTRGDACNPCLRDPLWYNERDWILNTYMPRRTQIVLDQFKRRDLYPDVSAPVLSHSSGELTPGTEVKIFSASTDEFFETPLVEPNSTAQIHFPIDDQLGLRWTEVDFSLDAEWFAGTNAVGFDTSGDYDALINTNLQSQMQGQHKSVFLRSNFEHDPASGFDDLQLRMWFDDGFVAYINGVEVARSSTLPTGHAPSEVSPRSNTANEVESFAIELSKFPNLLVDGTNVLAIHGVNRTVANSDFVNHAELVGRVRDESKGLRPIYFTTDGSDPRLVGGQINPAAIQYDGQLVIESNSRIRARVLLDGEWSAVAERIYTSEPYPVRITEVYYNPNEPTAIETQAIPGISNEDFEFLEFTNISDTETVFLDGFNVGGGVEFTFNDVSLMPGESVVIVEDATAFHQRFGDQPKVIGSWSGRLSNDGELLRLTDPNGNLVFEFTYDDANPWPTDADGGGASLGLIDPNATPIGELGDASRWKTEAPTPGTNNPLGIRGDFDDSGAVDAQDIDLLFSQIRSGEFLDRFDLNNDQAINDADRNVLIHDVIGTSFGDANLDGTFNSTDLVLIFQLAEYEDQTEGNSTWRDGDWDGDGDFTTRDLVLAFQQGAYSSNLRARNFFTP